VLKILDKTAVPKYAKGASTRDTKHLIAIFKNYFPRFHGLECVIKFCENSKHQDRKYQF
jgi:hypothetical protein